MVDKSPPKWYTLNMSDTPVKFYGPGVLSLTVGFFTANTRTQQVAVLTAAFGKSDPARLARLLAKMG